MFLKFYIEEQYFYFNIEHRLEFIKLKLMHAIIQHYKCNHRYGSFEKLHVRASDCGVGSVSMQTELFCEIMLSTVLI